MNYKTHYLVVDTETGGLDNSKHKLLEIGAAVFDSHGEQVDEYHCMLSPDENDNKFQTLFALKLNKFYSRYNKKEQDNKLTNQEMAKQFSKWLIEVSNKYDPILAGQNIKFDVDFIDRFLMEHGFAKWSELFGRHHLDTIMMARILQLADIVKTKRLNLKYLAEEFEIVNPDAHTALADVQTTAKVLLHMLNLLKKTNNN